ncbi:MAG: tyrosine kinase, partial [Myxococcaceae bacterium]|nr:tyrosine kinase [Myxococcaceae bacterium]
QGKTSETKLAELFWGSLDRSVATDTVQIGFKYGDPEDAQRVVQGLIDLFVNARRSTAVERAREALTTVDAQLHQLEGSLAERQQALDQFVLANEAMVREVQIRRGLGTRIVQIGPAGANPARPAESDNRTSLRTRRLQTRIAQLTAQVESLRNPNQTAAPAADEPAELTAMRERVRAKQAEVEGLRARGLTPDYPTRAAAERELLGMQTQLNAAIARQRGAQQNQQNLSQAEREARIESVNRDIQQARVELAESQHADNVAGGAQPNRPANAPNTPNPLTRNNTVVVEAEFDRLTTDVTTTRTNYTELLTRKLNNQAALRRAELSGGEQIRILDAPSRPIEPEPPGRTKMAMIVSVLAMLMALGTALISGFIDTRIYDQDDLRRWGELAELPFIPDLHFDGAGSRPRSAAPPPA